MIAISNNSVEDEGPTDRCSHPLELMRGDAWSASCGLGCARHGDTLHTFVRMTMKYVGADVSRLESSVTILCDNNHFC